MMTEHQFQTCKSDEYVAQVKMLEKSTIHVLNYLKLSFFYPNV